MSIRRPITIAGVADKSFSRRCSGALTFCTVARGGRAGASVTPHVNQLLTHVGNTPSELISYCESKGILVEAYSPIAHGKMLENSDVTAMAEKYGVSVPQLCIRYTLQLGTVSLPKTANVEHMRSNAEVDFEIADADMNTLLSVTATDYGEFSEFPVYSGK